MGKGGECNYNQIFLVENLFLEVAKEKNLYFESVSLLLIFRHNR